MPYGSNAVFTEYFLRLVDNGGQEYLAVTTMLDDPQYLQQPYVKTYQFKKQRDAAGWRPTPCSCAVSCLFRHPPHAEKAETAEGLNAETAETAEANQAFSAFSAVSAF